MRWFMGGVVVCVACGSPSPAMPDAMPDAFSTDVTVTTLALCCTPEPKSPQAGVVVVAYLADGTITDQGTSDANGHVTLHDVPAGAIVTAGYPETPEQVTNATSFYGVKPGDHLTFGESYWFAKASGAAGTMTVNVPFQTGTQRYAAYSPCSTNAGVGMSIALNINAQCQTTTTPIVASAELGAGEAIASWYDPAATFTPGAVVTAGPWVTNPMNNFNVSLSGIDPLSGHVGLGAWASYPVAALGGEGNPVLSGNSATIVVTVALTAPHIVAHARLERLMYGRHEIFRAESGTATMSALADSGLPWVGEGYVGATPYVAQWTQSAGNYDVTVLDLTWMVDAVHYRNWNVILPPGSSMFDFEKRPLAIDAFLPTPNDAVTLNVKLIKLENATDFDAVRKRPQWILTQPLQAAVAGDEPALEYAVDRFSQ